MNHRILAFSLMSKKTAKLVPVFIQGGKSVVHFGVNLENIMWRVHHRAYVIESFLKNDKSVIDTKDNKQKMNIHHLNALDELNQLCQPSICKLNMDNVKLTFTVNLADTQLIPESAKIIILDGWSICMNSLGCYATIVSCLLPHRSSCRLSLSTQVRYH